MEVDKTIVLHGKLATGSIHDYLFCYCPLVGILFEIRFYLGIHNFAPNLTLNCDVHCVRNGMVRSGVGKKVRNVILQTDSYIWTLRGQSE